MHVAFYVWKQISGKIRFKHNHARTSNNRRRQACQNAMCSMTRLLISAALCFRSPLVLNLHGDLRRSNSCQSNVPGTRLEVERVHCRYPPLDSRRQESRSSPSSVHLSACQQTEDTPDYRAVNPPEVRMTEETKRERERDEMRAGEGRSWGWMSASGERSHIIKGRSARCIFLTHT